jgi:hypothetical protein
VLAPVTTLPYRRLHEGRDKAFHRSANLGPGMNRFRQQATRSSHHKPGAARLDFGERAKVIEECRCGAHAFR